MSCPIVIVTAGPLIGDKEVFADNVTPAFQFSDTAAFSPRSAVDVETDIFIAASVGSTAQFRSFEQRFSQVPLPTSLVLVCAGLLGLAAARRRRFF